MTEKCHAPAHANRDAVGLFARTHLVAGGLVVACCAECAIPDKSAQYIQHPRDEAAEKFLTANGYVPEDGGRYWHKPRRQAS